MSELDKAKIDFITDPNELRFHAENPIEEDGRIHVTPELLFAVADKIDGLRAELARRDEIIARLKEENHALDQINRDIQTASAHLDEVLAELDRRDEELKITDGLLKEATETIGAVIACCTYNSNDDAKIGIYGIDQNAFTRIDQFITHYNDAISAGKVSVDVKPVKRDLSDAEIEEMGARSAEEKEKHPHLKRNDYCWSAFKTSWAAPAVNKRYLVMLENDWICCATYYLRVGGGYWKNDSGQEINTVVCWRSLDELR